MRSLALLSIILLSPLTACQNAPDNAASPPSASPDAVVPATRPSPTASGATLVVTDGAGNSGPLHLGSLARLVVDAAYRGIPGRHLERIDIIGPGGTLYAQLKGTLIADPAGRSSSSHSIEVKGTPIESFHMTGTWQFVLNVDGTPLASVSLSIVD